MEFPPKEWDVFPAEQFDTAVPRDPGELGMELLVQIRDTGRAQDHFRVALGGSKLLTAYLPMRDIFRVSEDFPEWYIEYSKWPADIILARNRTTSVWVDMKALIKSQDVVIRDALKTVIKYEDVLEMLANRGPHYEQVLRPLGGRHRGPGQDGAERPGPAGLRCHPQQQTYYEGVSCLLILFVLLVQTGSNKL